MEERIEPKKNKFYVCAIVKDEHEYVREWALHNKSLGFDKIILYDNNSAKSYDVELGDLIREGLIEVRTWAETGRSRQIRAYNDFVQSGNWSETDYGAFIDPDEFIFFDGAKTVSEFMMLYADYSGVGLSWRTYNANGRIESPNGKIPTVQAYTMDFDAWEPRIKFIGRLVNIGSIYSPHAFRPKKGCPPLITTGGEVVINQSPHYLDYTNGHIKHYITKSWQDWVKRLKRGNITKDLRTVETFFEFNPDMVHMKHELTKELNYNNGLPNISMSKKVNEKYYSAICLIIRDENDYLKEWLEWHSALGIEHFYIYDNGADIAPVSRVIARMSRTEQEKITVINWTDSYEHTQHDAYAHCLDNFGEDCYWIGFLDADEFLRIIEETTSINEFLKAYEEFGALRVSWLQYNANGRAIKEKLPLKQLFTQTVPGWDETGLGKVFVQPIKVEKMLTHHATLKANEKTCNENFEILRNVFRERFSADKIVIDHYYTKSYEEWCRKIKRGSADPVYQRKYDEFFKYNPEMKYLYNETMTKKQKYN